MEKKNKRRRKLLIPLFLSTFLLMTTTYAWFSANRVVSIESLNVHVQADNENQVQYNVYNSGSGKEEERTFRIACCTKNCSAEIVYSTLYHSAEIDTHIYGSKVDNVVRSLHKGEYRM